jgi:hypothetical protein
MNINVKDFPVLGCVQSNILTHEIIEFINRQVPDSAEQKELAESAAFFNGRSLRINYISQTFHKHLLNTSKFIKAKKFLKNSPTGAGLLLLPEVLYPDFTNVPDHVDVNSEDYPIDSILYSWLSINDHDKLAGDFDEEDPWEKEEDRQLFILPIYHDGTTQATKHFEMTSNDDIYGWEYSDSEGRAWYGKIHDYVMSFILCYNLTGQDSRQSNVDIDYNIAPQLSTQTHLNEEGNLIEIIR